MNGFRAIDGMRFFAGGSPYTLSAGRYATGEGALVVVAVDGQPECKLTVSLANYGAPALHPDEFYVKLETVGTVPCIQAALQALGVFHTAGPPIAQGYVTDYAVAWRFAVCSSEGHPGKGDDLVVECGPCRAKIRAAFEEGRTRLLADDAVLAIRGMKIGASGWG